MQITLLKPHRHERRDYQPGDQLTVDADTAQWLINIGVAEGVKPSNTKEDK